MGLLPSIMGGTPQQVPVNKTWVTQGDGRVRDSHLLADGQEQIR